MLNLDTTVLPRQQHMEKNMIKIRSNKPIIPFWMMPGSWGLKGKTKLIAQAEYESRTPYDLDSRLLAIHHGDNCDAMATGSLDLSLKHGYITEYEHQQRTAELSNSSDETMANLAKLDIDLHHAKITQLEYDRNRADLLKEPWVSMPVINWDPAISDKTYFQLDYNDYFYKFLLSNGYEGEEDDVVNRWINDVCISIIEEINDMDAELATPTRRGNIPPSASSNNAE